MYISISIYIYIYVYIYILAYKIIPNIHNIYINKNNDVVSSNLVRKSAR